MIAILESPGFQELKVRPLPSRYNLDILPSGKAFFTVFEKNLKLDL